MNEVMFPRGADLDEDARAVVVQRLDRLAEANRLRPVLDEQLADRVGLLGVRPAVVHDHSGVDWRRRTGQLREDRAQVLGERGEQRRVHGAVVGELLAHQPSSIAIARARAAASASPTSTTWWGQLSIAR